MPSRGKMRFLRSPLAPSACRQVLLATLVLTLACQGHRKAATAPGPDFNAARAVATALANAYETKTGRDLPVRIAEGTWTAIPNSRLVVAMRDYATTTDIVVERSVRIAPDSLTVLWFTASFRPDRHDLVSASIYDTGWSGFLFSVEARLEGHRWVIGEAEQTGKFITCGMKKKDTTYRFALALAAGASFMLIWVSMSVGLIGADGDPVNVMYFGVIAIGGIGALVSRRQPRGMARTLVAMAVGQTIVAAIALFGGLGRPWSGPLEIVYSNAFFVALFMCSAWLFRRSAASPANGEEQPCVST